MFLENWYKALTAVMYNHESVTGTTTSDRLEKFIGSSGSNETWNTTPLQLAGGISNFSTNYSKTPYMGLVRTSYNYGGVIFGNGSTEPNYYDYTLSGELITTINAAGSVSATPDDSGCTFVGTYAVTNTGSVDITIKEIGLMMAGAYSGVFLIERTVLDEPITIPAGGIGNVTYTIRMNYPTG